MKSMEDSPLGNKMRRLFKKLKRDRERKIAEICDLVEKARKLSNEFNEYYSEEIIKIDIIVRSEHL